MIPVLHQEKTWKKSKVYIVNELEKCYKIFSHLYFKNLLIWIWRMVIICIEEKSYAGKDIIYNLVDGQD